MMSLSKEKQDKYMDYLQKRPKLVKLLAKIITGIAYAASPFYVMYSVSLRKYHSLIVPVSPMQKKALKNKIENYISIMESDPFVFDKYGFIESEHCDALLFTGLIGAIGRRVMILAARDNTGAWHRRSTDRLCYPAHSKSSISRDMLLGLIWYIWRNKNLELANDLWDYGIKNSWIMGEGLPSRIYFTPGLQATLAEIIFKLGGKNHLLARSLPQTWTGSNTGYQAHLEILHIMLRGELYGYITSPMLKSLKDMGVSLKGKNTLNTIALSRYTKRDLTPYHKTALNDVLSEQYWPNDRLPTESDRKTRWIPEMEIDGNLPGKDSAKEFSGGDLLFCANILLNYSEK